MFFDRTSPTDIENFLFYFERVVETEAAEQSRERTLVGYLSGEAFEFYYRQSLRNEDLSDESQWHKLVQNALWKVPGANRDLQNTIDEPLLLMLHPKQSAMKSANHAEKEYSNAAFIMEQKLVFPSEAVLIDEQIQNCVFFWTATSFGELKAVFSAYDESCVGFQWTVGWQHQTVRKMSGLSIY